MSDRRRAGLRFARLALALALAPMLLGSPSAQSAASPSQEITAQEALAQQEAGSRPVFVDVRSAEEFASGRVPGAVNIPVKQLPSRLAELEKDDRLVVYCERGPRAAAAIDTLLRAGYTDVRHLMGDMAGWRAAGLPIEK